MTMRRALPFGVAAALLAAASLRPGPAAALPDFGNAVDEYCTSHQRTPATPFAGDCSLCHNPADFTLDRTELFTAYQQNDLDAFCPAAAPNRPPVFAPLASQSVSEDGLLSFQVTATDPDGNAISLEASGLPTGAVFTDQGGGVGQLVWMPTFEQAGNYLVTFMAIDDGVPPAGSLATITITVGDVNRPPVLAPIGNQALSPGDALSLALSASDPDGNALVFGAAGLPAGATLEDHHDGTATLAWTPGPSDAGSYAVTITVTDDGVPMASDAEAIAITVGSDNQPPVLAPIGDRTAAQGEPWTVSLSASDPDGDALAFACDGAPPTATLADAGNGTALLTGTGSEAPGNYAITCSVTDDGVPPASDSESFQLAIGSVNRPPTLDPVGVTRERAWIFVRLTAHDPDGNHLHFSVSGLPEGAEFVDHGDGTAELSWLPVAAAAGDYPVTFTVTDDGVPPESASADVTIRVKESPQTERTPFVRRATWSARRGALALFGGGAPPGASVEILDAASGLPFATARADWHGRFVAWTKLDASTVPCSVQARAAGLTSEPHGVNRAPARCRSAAARGGPEERSGSASRDLVHASETDEAETD
jgi:hypothetical protein